MKKLYSIFILALALAACQNDVAPETTASPAHDHAHNEDAEHHNDHETEGYHLSKAKFQEMGLLADSLQYVNIDDWVEVNGYLQVPPQNEATVTSILGANVKSIQVIEGQKIKENQVLAYLTHPEIIRIQTQYVQSKSRLKFLEQSLERTKKLYDEQVASGKEYQATDAEYKATKGEVLGLEAELKLLSIDPKKVENGKIYESIPVVSPISGYIRKVFVKTGQFVSPSKEMFDIVNNDHVHADLMVFEKDINKVKEGQTISFKLQAAPHESYTATIFSVGKAFESDPKAVHIHADIKDKKEFMLPGMYVQGKISTSDHAVLALPNEAITTDKGKNFAFILKDEGEEYDLQMVEVIVTNTNEEYSSVRLADDLKNKIFLQNKAYYMMAELMKGEAEHGH
ncbi:membrane fusion protein, cobalt-zinc-cadmium efflux system [Lishizhenia tianjinensis]|uniref:Membrane fusion protein, cobalt-zinc-cadmium efflux system n=1 Tax=Lishizhenia tianjinensis TaxID=477690 RepID=A0A1I6YXP0_9FLAO|nr:efflux RND transporter periplasmic adaptor subunit [Lishizhenia tianjinensis]SFT54971.1 membrane fusion protein, cobalt-zinc-cadmium efflux system [Lishizhenia tianjinensis]